MDNPFQDQFIKAGLVSKKQVRKANIEQRTKEKAQKRKPGEAVPAAPGDLALRLKKEQVRQSNAMRDQAAREREVAAQLKQLVNAKRVRPGLGQIAYHFADANKIKKFSLPKKIVDQLSEGVLGIVKIEDVYELVPADTAEKVRERCPEALLVLNIPQPPDPNDPYAAFPVPDDYDW